MNERDLIIVFDWWQKLKDDPGSRAELRRAHNPTEVVFLPVYHRLYARFSEPNREALSCVAGLCAHIKESRSGIKMACQMAEGGDKPKVSPLRFRRFLAINDREELYHAMIRIIRLLGGTLDVLDFAKIVYWWNEKTKKQLAYDYYAIANVE